MSMFFRFTQILEQADIANALERYHYAQDDYEELFECAGLVNRLAAQEGGIWVSEVSEEGRCCISMTLGRGIDTLMDACQNDGAFSRAYMIEVLSSDLLLKAYSDVNELLHTQSGLNVNRLYFYGSSELPIEEIGNGLKNSCCDVIHTNAAYCLIPAKSVVYQAALSDSQMQCEAICTGCGRIDCPNRMQSAGCTTSPGQVYEKTLQRPLTYGYARIFGK